MHNKYDECKLHRQLCYTKMTITLSIFVVLPVRCVEMLIEMQEEKNTRQIVREAFLTVNNEYLRRGAQLKYLKCAVKLINNEKTKEINDNYFKRLIFIATIISLIIAVFFYNPKIDYILTQYIYETRCFIPNNYLVWEFTRPISNCDFCRGIDSPLNFENLTKEEFLPHAYSSRPMVIKNAAKSWPASQIFSLEFFRDLYKNIDGAYTSIEEECQFLPFKSNFTSLKEVLEMSHERASNPQPVDSWYVGWKNCHSDVLETMKKYYQVPHFLPNDIEIPQTNYIFLGYDEGAIMHIDYIPRLMWQGQIIGKKIWSVAPTTECDSECVPFNFTVGTGDIILLDTRIWYHGTYVENGKFSLTVTSEYG
ncbi:hypothetical protein PV328_009176 [Microctonus aethiopoides]|uniref:Cupin-like domain-containing protein n=1 Tax=Microctonus aethiopoides TaxID=144406 RepID=A0AA39C621_9HYME|nr:hypothetical protein PV328_009176 [Microctonus aethiopoides]